ncbi:hypothetical protein GGER_00390 [Serratia rubidaea]
MPNPDVYIGHIQTYPGGRPSAIAKRQVDGALPLTPLGLEGDQQAEKATTAAPIARCAITRLNIMTTGGSSFRRRPSCSARRHSAKTFQPAA